MPASEADNCAQDQPLQKGVVTLLLEVRGVKSVSKLIARISEIDGVVAVQAGAESQSSE